jgi:hypothetical protein
MKIGRSSRRSFRSAIFIGVLAGSVFSGSGAFADISISSQTDLADIGIIDSKPLSGSYYLANSFEIVAPIDGSSYVGGTFTGTFDGNGKTISNLVKPLFDVVDGSSSEVLINDLNLVVTDTVIGSGILANSGTNARIESVTTAGNVSYGGANIGGLIGTGTNLVVTDVHTRSGVLTNLGWSGYTGGIIGLANGVLEGRNRITDSSSTLTIDSNSASVGGLVGNLATSNGLIQDSFYSGTVTGNIYVGGLVGANYGIIERSNSSGSITANSGVGGLVGLQTGGEIKNSTSSAMVTTASSFAGGLVGQSQADGAILPTVENSHTSGLVNGGTSGTQIGGLIGQSVGVVSQSWASGRVIGRDDVGGLIGNLLGNVDRSYASGDVSGIANVGGLIGRSEGSDPNTFVIQNSYALGDINLANDDTNWSSAVNAGGLIGATANSRVTNTYATGDVGAMTAGGGLIGRIFSETLLENSFATGNVYISSSHAGGLVGDVNDAELNNLMATGDVVSRGNTNLYLGGLVGNSVNSEISNSKYIGSINFEELSVGNNDNVGGAIGYATSTNLNNVHSTATVNTNGSYVGGLIGYAFGEVTIQNSSTIYNLNGYNYVGGLVGYSFSIFSNGLSLQNSFGRGTILGCELCNETASYIGTVSPSGLPVFINGASAGVGKIIQDIDWEESVSESVPASVLQGFSTTRISTNTWAKCAAANGTLPYLIALFPSDPCAVGSGSGGTRTGREKIERDTRELKESRTPEKIEKTLGFENESSLPKNAAISFIDITEKIDLAKIKAVEIVPTSNVKMNAKAGEALQISLKSESKEPVELWVKSPDGSWLLAGVITFDKDGKAILPPLQFKSVGDYSLVLSKPSADSAKGSAPLNQTGSLLVAVS